MKDVEVGEVGRLAGPRVCRTSQSTIRTWDFYFNCRGRSHWEIVCKIELCFKRLLLVTG